MTTMPAAEDVGAVVPGQPEVASRPWRRYLRFSVRGLMVLVLIIGGWMGWLVRSARIQRESVAAVRAAGCWVYYRSEIDGSSWWWNYDVTWRNWLESHVGVDYCDDVGDVISTRRTHFTDTDMAHVGQFSALTGLALDDSAVTDAGLAHLKGLTSLRTLSLKSCPIRDAGLEHLGRLASLVDLDLGGTQVTDAGLVHLKSLSDLRRIDLSKTPVTDAGLVHLKTLPHLRCVLLDSTGVTDAGQNALKQALPGLNIVR